jgi:hypothetical protein
MSRFGPVLALVLMAATAWAEGRALLVLTATGQLWCADTDSGDENPPWIEVDPRSPTATFHFEESTSVIDRSELRFDLPNVMVWEGITFRPCE